MTTPDPARPPVTDFASLVSPEPRPPEELVAEMNHRLGRGPRPQTATPPGISELRHQLGLD